MILLDLFWTFFKIGAFSFGGGYAMIPLLEREIVRSHGWLSLTEFVDVAAIAEMTPGPIAINSATFVGYKMAGFAGSVAATLGVVAPSLLIVLTLAFILCRYRHSTIVNWIFEGIRPVTVALIIAAGAFLIGGSMVDYKGVIIAAGVFGALQFTRLHPILLLALAGIAGAILY